MKATTSQYITQKRSKIHSRGIFAKKDIPEGTKVIEYVGEKITKAESDRRADVILKKAANDVEHGSVYIFQLNKRHDIDGHVSYNTARLINHSCDPNCDTDIIRGKIWIMSFKDIKKGEEITYNYGYDLEDYEEHPCRCGSKNCVGYILNDEFWPRLKRALKRKALKKKQLKKKTKKKSKKKTKKKSRKL